MKKIFGFTFNVCLSMLVFALLLTSCVRKKHDLGKVITKEVKVTPFQDIAVYGNATVHIVPGDTYKVVIKGKQKLVGSVEVEQSEGGLTINDAQNNIFPDNELRFGKFTREDFVADVYITMPTLHNVYLESNASLSIDKAMTADSVSFGMLGNSSVDIAGLTAKELKIKAQGNMNMGFAHLTVDRMQAEVQGNASVDVNFDMGGDVDFIMQGNGSATLSGVTRNKPNCTMSGNGSVDDHTTRAQK